MPMKVCKLCFKNIKDDTLLSFINPNISLCPYCYRRLNPHFISFMVLNYKALAFYYYDEDIRALLYQFKGCFDYELAKSFLDRYFKEIKMKYVGYIIIPVPSYHEDDEIRGFNHVEEIFRHIGLPMRKVLKKTSHFKQADHNKKERKDIYKHMELSTNKDLRGQKVLIVDDVYTTGSTMKAAIRLVEKLHPKDIKVLVMSKTKIHRHYN